MLDQEFIKICKDFSACEIFSLQAVIDFNIIPQLIRMLDQEEFDIRKECAWAISNATSGGDDMQIKYLVDQVRFFEFLVDKPISLRRVHDVPLTCEIPPVNFFHVLSLRTFARDAHPHKNLFRRRERITRGLSRVALQYCNFTFRTMTSN